MTPFTGGSDMHIKHMECGLRVKALDPRGVFSGYASVFGALDQQNEIVAPGAFTRSLGQWRKQGRLPAMLWMHDPTQPVGLWLSVKEDSNGLAVDGRLALRTQKGGEAYELLKMGALTGLSIGYRVIASRIDAARKARVLTDVDLFEISLVTFPANEAARVDDVKRTGDVGLRRELRAAAARLQNAARRLRAV
ncbi:MAG TPA: HK97 family phage prohead protease [Alphaproteobacteria bacterium]|nr:HK97 family phage prohead protease [Alphaproteobacteria bacterium]